jgi:hypothetical protein
MAATASLPQQGVVTSLCRITRLSKPVVAHQPQSTCKHTLIITAATLSNPATSQGRPTAGFEDSRAHHADVAAAFA